MKKERPEIEHRKNRRKRAGDPSRDCAQGPEKWRSEQWANRNGKGLLNKASRKPKRSKATAQQAREGPRYHQSKKTGNKGKYMQKYTAAKARPRKETCRRKKKQNGKGNCILNRACDKNTVRQYTVSRNKKRTRYSNTEHMYTEMKRHIYRYRDTDMQGTLEDTGPTREHPAKYTEGQPRDTEGK